MKIPWFKFGREKRALGSNWTTLFPSQPNSSSGEYVDHETAMKLIAVYAAVKYYSKMIASLPAITYRRLPGGGKERAKDHWLYSLLLMKPNLYQSSFEFWSQLIGHLVLRGNGYALIDYGPGNKRGIPQGFHVLHPDRMKVYRDEENNGNAIYLYRWPKGSETKFVRGEVFHLKDYSINGLVGLSPIEQAADSLGRTIAAEKYGGRFFKNSVRPSGFFKHPGAAGIGELAHKHLKEELKQVASGENQHAPLLLEENISFEKMGVTNEEAQFLETLKDGVRSVARLMGLPPHVIGDLSDATFSNIEQQSLETVTSALRPVARLAESAIQRDILLDDEEIFVEFLFDALLRGDLPSRYGAYAVGRTGGWLCVDEIREFENMNPLPDGKGKEYLNPLNMVPAGQNPPAKEPTPVQKTPAIKPKRDDSEQAELRNMWIEFFSEPIGRAVRREAADLKPSDLQKDWSVVYGRHRLALRNSIYSSVRGVAKYLDTEASAEKIEGVVNRFLQYHANYAAHQLNEAMRREENLLIDDEARELVRLLTQEFGGTNEN